MVKYSQFIVTVPCDSDTVSGDLSTSEKPGDGTEIDSISQAPLPASESGIIPTKKVPTEPVQNEESDSEWKTNAQAEIGESNQAPAAPSSASDPLETESETTAQPSCSSADIQTGDIEMSVVIREDGRSSSAKTAAENLASKSNLLLKGGEESEPTTPYVTPEFEEVSKSEINTASRVMCYHYWSHSIQ